MAANAATNSGSNANAKKVTWSYTVQKKLIAYVALACVAWCASCAVLQRDRE